MTHQGVSTLVVAMAIAGLLNACLAPKYEEVARGGVGGKAKGVQSSSVPNVQASGGATGLSAAVTALPGTGGAAALTADSSGNVGGSIPSGNGGATIGATAGGSIPEANTGGSAPIGTGGASAAAPCILDAAQFDNCVLN